MTFLDPAKIRSEIKSRLDKTSRFDAAIAFWGDGANTWLKDLEGKDVRIICNLLSGGTNPKVIRELKSRGVQVKRRDDLHAKVYLFSDSAIIGSANFSANGLGFEGKEAQGWLEAGVALDGAAAKPARDWFEGLWQSRLTSDVEESDLKAAQLIWNRNARRQRPKMTVADFDFERPLSELPMVTWIGDEEWDLSPQTEKMLEGWSPEEREALKWQIDNSLEIEGPEDRKFMTPGRWVLQWKRGRFGGIAKRSKLEWVCVDKILPGAYFYHGEEGELKDAVLAAIKPGPPPFFAEDPLLKQAIEAALKKYPKLNTDEYDEAWFPHQEEILKLFWLEVQKQYGKLKGRSR